MDKIWLHKTSVINYIPLSIHNHLTVNPDYFFDLVYACALRFDKLTHVDDIMTQTHHAHQTLVICLSPLYKLSDTTTSALTPEQVQIQLVLMYIGFPLFFN